MSRLKQRKEKNCLNCNAEVLGRFCQNCGQENIEPKESVWDLVSHFFRDITHFDGNFFSTVKYLIFRPGFLSKEYMIGRRASYVNPVRLYIFTSAFFFLIFFSFYQHNEEINITGTQSEILSRLESKKNELQERINLLSKLTELPGNDGNEMKTAEKRLQEVEADILLIKQDSTAKNRLQSLEYSFNVISVKAKDSSKKYNNLRQYDSVQNALPANKRDGFIINRIERQNLHLREKYENNSRAILMSIIQNFMKRFPQMLFVSLPLFALLLKLLYIRRKNYYYVNHIIYAIHLYCASFIIILVSLWFSSIFGWFHVRMPGLLNFLFILSGFFYAYKAQRNFYQQRRAKTILKYMLLLFMSIILMALLFSVFFIFSTFSL